MEFFAFGLAPILAAAGEPTTISDAVTGAMTTAANDMLGLLGSAVPIVLPVVAGVLLVSFGIKILRKFGRG